MRWPTLLVCSALLLAFAVTAPAQAQAEVSTNAAPQGDPDRGRLVFGQCRSCHELIPGHAHGHGPNLYRIFGKVAGKQPGFRHYSKLLKAAKFVWTPELLAQWLADPQAFFPGSTMMSPGVPDPRQRADLLAYLRHATVRDSELPPP